MTVTIPSKKLDGLSARLGAFMSRLAALADRPRSPTGTTPEDRADRQRAVAFASPERSELGINDEVAAPPIRLGRRRKSIIRPPTLAHRLRSDSRHLAGRVDRRPYAEVGNTLLKELDCLGSEGSRSLG